MTQYQLVAAIARTPATKLLGTSPKGFNATGEHESDSYDQELVSIQSCSMTPLLDRHHLLLCRSRFSGHPGLSISTEWNPVRKLKPADVAAINLQKAQTAQIEAAVGAISGEEERERLKSDPLSEYQNLPDEIPEDVNPEGEEAGGAFGSETPPPQGEHASGMDAGTFKEEDHKRADDGKFGSGGGKADAAQAATAQNQQQPQQQNQQPAQPAAPPAQPVQSTAATQANASQPQQATAPAPADGNAPSGATKGQQGKQDITQLLGEEHTGVKGQDAINKLLETKSGHVKGAFTRSDLGDIDLVWGSKKEKFGLEHIIAEREAQGIEPKRFLSDLATVIEKGYLPLNANGKPIPNDKGRYEISLGDKVAVVAPELRDNKIMLLLTAFDSSVPSPKHKKRR